MKMDAWHLPWGKETVPHAVLDVIRGCNISCNACYNSRPAEVKPIETIQAELDQLLSLRRLSSISIAWG